MTERSLLDAARGGDHEAFSDLVEPHRRVLYAHCYRMLRSFHDAEDATQETLLRAWRSLATFSGQTPIRAWLYRIATNVCLTAIDKRAHHAPPTDAAQDEPLPDGDEWDPMHVDYERQETAALAATVTLRRLSDNQRAALILRDVLGYPAREAACKLGTSVASVNSSLQRARATVADPVEVDSVDHAAEHFVNALARGDVEAAIAAAT